MSPSAEKWCCEGVRQYFTSRGERGVFVFAEPPDARSNQPSFWLAVHAADEGDLAVIRQGTHRADLAVMLQTWIPVRFCPWCGRKLARFYRNQWRQLYDPQASEAHGWGTSRDTIPR